MASLEFVLSAGLALLCAVLLAGLLRAGGGTLWLIFVVVASFGVVVTLASLIAGLGGLLNAAGLAATLAALTLVSGWCLVRQRRAGSPPPVEPEAQAPQAPSASRLASAATAVGLAACLTPLSLVVAELLLGPCRFEFDDYAYHGLMIGHWLQRDLLHLAPAKFQAYYPGGGELLSAFFIETGGGDAFAQVASLYWTLLATLSFPVAARALGAAPGTALVCAGLLLCSPFVADNLGTMASVDFAAGAASLATIAAGLHVSVGSARVPARGALVLLGALAGLAVGTKVTVVVLVAPVVTACGWLLARRAGERLPLAATLVLLGGVLTGGYWYIRNVAVTGNPVFPAEVLFFDGPLDRAFQRSTSLLERVLEENEPRRLRTILEDLTSWPVTAVWIAGAGLAYAIAMAPFERASGRRWLMPLLALLAVASFWITFSGPFSGSANSLGGVTRVAPRMFLPCMMVALLVAGAAPMSRNGGMASALNAALVIAGGALVASWSSDHKRLPVGLTVAAIAIVLWWLRRAIAAGAQRLPRAITTSGLPVLLAAGLTLLGSTVSVLQPSFDRKNRGWLEGALDDLPEGARIATPNVFSYYALFGPDFELDPFRVDGDGQPYALLHIEWRDNPHYSWKYEFGAKYKKELRAEHEAKIPKTGWRAIEDPQERKLARRRETLAALDASGADYILVASYRKASILHGAKPKPRDRPFPPIIDLLDQSSQYRRIRDGDEAMLYSAAD